MDLKLHANATTTPRTRAYIQQSTASVAELAAELGVSEKTIRRWRGRSDVSDRSHTPRNLAISLSALEETLVCELRRDLGLPLDDITEVMRRCLHPGISRRAVHRCLRRHRLNQRSRPQKPAAGTFETAPVGFIHIDLKHLPALEKQRSFAFVAIDRATRYVFLEVHPARDAATTAAFLERFLDHFPHPVHTVLTDNGGEFTDRFAVDRRNKPRGKPSGQHPFDRLCAQQRITHRLTRPFRPQTNGMVERFNRRIADALRQLPAAQRNQGKNKFNTHAQRNAFLQHLVHNYNRTRLKCLGYTAPLHALANPTEHYTRAGAGEGV